MHHYRSAIGLMSLKRHVSCVMCQLQRAQPNPPSPGSPVVHWHPPTCAAKGSTSTHALLVGRRGGV